MKYLNLFTRGFLYVVFVAFNQWQISNNKAIGLVPVGFMISFLWTFNVKSVAFGSHLDRAVYAFGAGVGTLSGWYGAKVMYGG